MQDIFRKIFCSQHWYNEESFSGPGSCLLQTETIRCVLPKVLSHLKVKTLFDIPCGDFNWMNEVDLKAYPYLGADIVNEIVNSNNLKYSNRNKRFIWADITTSILPRVDLVLCRDCLVHFSYEDIKKAIENIKNSGSKYLLTTTFPGRSNIDIPTGLWRPIDMQLEPFSFPKPIQLINENCTEENGRYEDKSMGLWSVADLPD